MTTERLDRTFEEPEIGGDDFARLLRLTAGTHESSPLLWHRGRNGHRWYPTEENPNPPRSLTTLGVAAPCSDVFYWGCADAEDIGPDDIDAYATAIGDVRPLISHQGPDRVVAFAGWLYAARRRNMRPQGAVYPGIPDELWYLFDAAGPEREIGLANPKPRSTTSGSSRTRDPDCLHVIRVTPVPAWTPQQLVTLFGAASFDSQSLLRWQVDTDDRLRVFVVNDWAEQSGGGDCTVGIEIAPAHTEAFIAAIQLERTTSLAANGLRTLTFEGEPPAILARFSAMTGLCPPKYGEGHTERTCT